jgi:hypothetical protein
MVLSNARNTFGHHRRDLHGHPLRGRRQHCEADSQTSMVAAILKAQSLWPNARHILTTLPPRIASTAGTLENRRLSPITWLAACPSATGQCVDFEDQLTDFATPARLRSEVNSGESTGLREAIPNRQADTRAPKLNATFDDNRTGSNADYPGTRTLCWFARAKLSALVASQDGNYASFARRFAVHRRPTNSGRA